LPGILDRLNLKYVRRGPRWTLTAGDASQSAPSPDVGAIEIDGSSAMHQITMCWFDVSAKLRRDIETELGRDFSAINMPASPASTWFMTAAGCMLTMMIFLLVTFLIITHPR
jgi:hypothetical protein